MKESIACNNQDKRLKKYCAIGAVFILLFSGLLSFFSDFLGETLSILISPVNSSLWENMKSIIICYIIWSFVTLAAVSPPFKKFVACAVFTLYGALTAAIILYYFFYMLTGGVLWLSIALAIFIVCASQYALYRLTISDIKAEQNFVLAVFMLVLIFVCLCCFSVFPPRLPMFFDYTLGLYGIIPDSFDVGAVFLEKNLI